MNDENYNLQKKLIKEAINEVHYEELKILEEILDEEEKNKRKKIKKFLIIYFFPFILMFISLIIGGFISFIKK